MGGEAEFDSSGGHSLFNHKGAQPLMVQFLGWVSSHVVLGIQPYLSFDLVSGVQGSSGSCSTMPSHPLCVQGWPLPLLASGTSARKSCLWPLQESSG